MSIHPGVTAETRELKGTMGEGNNKNQRKESMNLGVPGRLGGRGYGAVGRREEKREMMYGYV